MRVLKLGAITINLDSSPLNKEDFYKTYTGKVPNIETGYKEYVKALGPQKTSKRKSKKASS